MSATGAIQKIIASDGTAATLLTGGVHSGVIPENITITAASITLIGNTPNNTKTGVSTEDLARIQIDVWAETLSKAEAAGNAIRTALDYYSGTVTLSDASTVNVDLIQYETEQQVYSDVPEAYRKTYEYELRLKR